MVLKFDGICLNLELYYLFTGSTESMSELHRVGHGRYATPCTFLFACVSSRRAWSLTMLALPRVCEQAITTVSSSTGRQNTRLFS